MKRTEKEKTSEGARIEFWEDRKVYVDGCVSILEYEPETVKLDVGAYCIRLIGSDLQLVSLSEKSIMICGVFSEMQFRC